MSEQLTVPDLVVRVNDLRREVYELERRRIPQGSGTVTVAGIDSLDPLVFRRADDVNAGNEYLATVFTFGFPSVAAPVTSEESGTVVAWGDPAAEPYLDRYVANEVYETTHGWQFYGQGKPGGDFTDFYLDGRRSGSDDSRAEFVWDAGQLHSRTATLVAGRRWAFGAMQCNASAGSITEGELDLTIREHPPGAGGNFMEFDVKFTINNQHHILLLDVEFQDGSFTLFDFEDPGSGPRFAIFDGGGVNQAAAVDVSAESAAVQAVYAALRAYGWFGP